VVAATGLGGPTDVRAPQADGTAVRDQVADPIEELAGAGR